LSPISCHDDLAALLAADPSPEGGDEAEAVTALTDAFVETCTKRHGDVLPFLGTVSAARDLDRIREALGDEKLTYVGFSYGTRLGSVYAPLFPEAPTYPRRRKSESTLAGAGEGNVMRKLSIVNSRSPNATIIHA